MNSLDSNGGSNFLDKLRPFNFESTVCDEGKIDKEPITSTSQGNKFKRDWKGNLGWYLCRKCKLMSINLQNFCLKNEVSNDIL